MANVYYDEHCTGSLKGKRVAIEGMTAAAVTMTRISFAMSSTSMSSETIHQSCRF